MLQPAFLALLLLNLINLLIAQPVPPITLTIVQGTPFTLPNCVDFHEPSGTLLLSENYPDGTPYNFDRILFDGTHVQFSNISGLRDEIYIAAVRSEYIHSLRQGFQLGDMFTGNGKDGEIMRIQTDANGNNPIITNPWTKLTAPNGQSVGLLRGGLTFDYTGYWNGDLIVTTTTGKAYRVNATGHSTLIGDCGEFIEGAVVIPNDPNRYGRYAANIVAGGDSNRDIIWTFAPGQTPKRWTVTDQGQAFENMNYIFPYTNFWLVNKNDGHLLASSWQDWETLAGEVLLGEEFPQGGRSGLYLLRYRSSDQQLYVVPVPLTPDSYVPSHFEGAVFAAAGINNIAPAVNVCFVGFWSGTTFKATPYKLNPGPSTPSPFYGYNTVAAWSPDPHTSTPNVPRPQSNRIVFYWSLTHFNVLFLTILVDAPNDGSDGNAVLELSSVNLLNNSITLILKDDDPSFSSSSADFADNYYWSTTTGDGLFQWRWGSSTSDGVILGPFPLYQANNIKKGYCVRPRLLSSSGLDPNPMYLASYDPVTGTTTYTQMGTNPEICVYLCPQFCFLYGTCTDCTRNSECIWCASTQTCQNRNPSVPQVCPGNNTITTCPCETFTSQGCGACTANPGCEWCCQNNIGSCVSAGQCSGTSYNNATCGDMALCTPSCQNGGQCVCSRCQCPAGLFGADCSETRDCLGVINGTATVDICGVCGGNGTSCLGCDGKPYGINFYDKCGVCGGNGMSCFNPCNTTNCTQCVAFYELCSWCPVEQMCIRPGANETCMYANESATGILTCPSPQVLTPEQIVGLSAGAIAAIIIAIVVVLAVTAGVSGRMIYVRYHRSQGPQDIVQNNPVYETKTYETQNPVYKTEMPKT